MPHTEERCSSGPPPLAANSVVSLTCHRMPDPARCGQPVTSSRGGWPSGTSAASIATARPPG